MWEVGQGSVVPWARTEESLVGLGDWERVPAHCGHTQFRVAGAHRLRCLARTGKASRELRGGGALVWVWE